MERRHQQALIATESATRQKLEQVIVDEDVFALNPQAVIGDRAVGKPATRSGPGALPVRQQTKAELEAQKRQRGVLDSQELLLHADLDSQ